MRPHVTARCSTTQKLHDALPHRQTLTAHKQTSWEHDYMCGARSGSPKLRCMISILSEASQIHAVNTIIQGLPIVLVMYSQSWGVYSRSSNPKTIITFTKELQLSDRAFCTAVNSANAKYACLLPWEWEWATSSSSKLHWTTTYLHSVCRDGPIWSMFRQCILQVQITSYIL